MRSLGVAALLLLAAPSAAHATNVSGAITANTTWTLANSPYTVTATVTVSNSATLTIEAGAQVRFNANTGLTISSGILIAQGTATQPITFTSHSATPAPGQWNGISFASTTTPASLLDYCIIEYGGAGANNANVMVTLSTPAIKHSTLRFSDGYGLYVAGTSARPALTDNTFASNGGFPLRIELAQVPTPFTGNTFTGNGTQAVELNGVYPVNSDQKLVNPGIPYIASTSSSVISGGKLTVQAGVQVRYNANMGLLVSSGKLNVQGTAAAPVTFTSNSATPAPGQWTGIFFTGNATGTLDNAIIEYGGAGFNDADVNVVSSSPTFRHCTLRLSDGAGLRLTSTASLIEHSTITGNVQGIVVSTVTGPEVIRHNTITGNAGAGLVNSSVNGVAARLNWWGQASGPAGIGPGSGDAITGNVLFEPWLGQSPTEPFRWTDAFSIPDPISPSGGVTTFTGFLPEAANWAITIKNSSGAVVRTFTGSGTSFTQDWTGVDNSGVAQPDGVYAYQMDATSTAGAKVAAPAAGLITLTNALPVAHMTSPTQTQLLVAGSIDVVGTAASGGVPFQSYRVEYNTGPSPSGWIPIISRTTPVTNGVLATWNAALLTQPVYTLRLTTTATTGQTASDQVTIRLLSLSGVTAVGNPFSPDGDGQLETTTLQATATYPVNWTLTIKNGSGATVRTFTGKGQTAIQQTWNGKDASGVVVPDGTYTYQFQVTEPSSGLTITSAANPVTVDTVPPVAAITSPAENQTILVDDPLSITGTASDANFRTYQVAYAVGNPPGAFINFSIRTTQVTGGTLETLNVRSLAPNTYTLRLTVSDAASHTVVVLRSIVLDHLTVANVAVNPTTINPFVGQSATVGYTLNRPADVTLRVYHDRLKQLMRTMTQPGRPSGANTVSWDGRDDGGAVVEREAYYTTLEATDAAGRRGRYNDPVSPQMDVVPITSGVPATAGNFDPFRNDLARLDYTFSRFGRLRILIRGSTSQIIRTIADSALRGAGPHSEYWDGRLDDGTLYGGGSFSWFLDVPTAVALNAVMVDWPAVEIQNARANSYVIHASFNELSTLNYTLSLPATVSVSILDPNGNTVRTLLSNASQAAGDYAFEWDGRTDAGRVLAVPGDYTFLVTARDAATATTVTRRGVIVVYR